MSDSPTPASLSLARRFARLVARMQSEPAALAEHRQEVRAIAKALKKSPIAFALAEDGGLRVGGAVLTGDSAADATAADASPATATDATPDDATAISALSAQCAAYGLEQVTLGASATEADLFDLVKLLATPSEQPDPLTFFAARAAAIDARAIPRVLRKKDAAPIAADEEPSVKEPASVREPASVKEAASAKARLTPVEMAAIIEAASAPEPKSADSADLRSERLTEGLAVPQGSDAELAALFSQVARASEVTELRVPLERMVFLADIAFRTGKFDRMLEVMTALVAIEFNQLEQDASDERRREFAQALRRLASPVILRQLAVLRHHRADDALAAKQLQSLLYRFGSDGAEALMDEWASAATPEARQCCLLALRELRRTHDALFEALRNTDTLRVRQAVDLLGALGDPRAEQLLLEQIRHPDAKTRRAVVAALDGFTSASAFDAVAVAAIDEDQTVRLRAVAALSRRGAPAVKLLAPMLESEPEREVLLAAVAALGNIGTPEAVQVLVRCANGETSHPLKRNATYRLQACAALALVRSPQAMAAVQLLRNDRDREVREGSMRLVAQASRRSAQVTALNERSS